MCDLLATDYLVAQYQYEQQVRQPSASTSKALTQSEFTQINILLAQGKALIAQKNYQQAITTFDQGIERLGHRYLSEHLDDDTDMKLILANEEQQKGNSERAAHLKHNVLASRIEVYQKLHSKPEKIKK